MALYYFFSVSLIPEYHHRIWYFPVIGVKRGGRGGCMFLKKRRDIKKGGRKKKGGGGLIHLYALWLDKLQNWICRTVGPSLAASLELLTHIWNVASLSLFYRHYFGRCSSELNWLNWFHSLILEEGLPVILIDCIIFLSPFLNVVRMSMSVVSFLAQLNSGTLCL